MPRISIVTTAFDRDLYLGAAMRSVLDQSFADWSLMIVDDASTDGTYPIAKAFVAMDDRISMVRNQVNSGCGAANERGLRLLIDRDKPDFIAWLDSDDLLHPDALKKTIAYLDKNPGAGMVYTLCQTIDSQGQKTGFMRRPKLKYSPANLLQESMVFHFRVVRTDAYLEMGGFDPELREAVDYDFCLRFSETHVIEHLPEVLYSYRVHGGCMSITRSREQAKSAELARKRARIRRGVDAL
jgi:glycosyltransferase involved in cell wall biosynthesis